MDIPMQIPSKVPRAGCSPGSTSAAVREHSPMQLHTRASGGGSTSRSSSVPCVPWMATMVGVVGITLLQTVLLIVIISKAAMVSVSWEHDHKAHRPGDNHVLMRNAFEHPGSVGDLGDMTTSALPAEAHLGTAAGVDQRQRLQQEQNQEQEVRAGAGAEPRARHWWSKGRSWGIHSGGAGGPAGSDHDRKAAAGAAVEDPHLFHEEVSTWPYTCWTPAAGMSSPRLTMVTVIDGLPKSYQQAVTQNRLYYAARHGYRYCELQTRDRFKIPAFTKLPWMLALAPCSEFVIHLDADAQLVNMTNSLKPWLHFMETKGIDQLFAQDIIVQSPINYGVFMIRTVPWIWSFYRKVYNYCTCDWSRQNDWPAEQGIVYDLMAGNLDSYETTRSLIVSNKGWNHIIDSPGQEPEPHDALVHLTYPRHFPPNHTCFNATYRKDNVRHCKYLGLEYFLTEVVGSKHYDPALNLTTHFVKDENSCHQVRENSLFVGKTTYSNQNDALSGSVMDFDVDAATGQVTGIKVSEVGCMGYRDKKCSLPRLWDVEKGRGPWEKYKQEIV